jgi:hypothetical protein
MTSFHLIIPDLHSALFYHTNWATNSKFGTDQYTTNTTAMEMGMNVNECWSVVVFGISSSSEV